MKVTDLYRRFHSNTKEYTFFPAPHKTFSKINHILSQKVSLTRYKNNGNNYLYLIIQPWVKVGVQQHKPLKVYELMETKQLSTEYQ